MQQLLSEAQTQHGDLSQGIADLQKALAAVAAHPSALRRGHPRLIKRGNQDEMKKLLDEARQAHQQQGDLGKAIKDLEKRARKVRRTKWATGRSCVRRRYQRRHQAPGQGEMNSCSRMPKIFIQKQETSAKRFRT